MGGEVFAADGLGLPGIYPMFLDFFDSPLIIHLVFLEFLCQSNPPNEAPTRSSYLQEMGMVMAAAGGFWIYFEPRVPGSPEMYRYLEKFNLMLT